MALFLTKELDSGAKIYVWEIAETEEELLKNNSVPEEELEELSYISSPQRRVEKLAVRALLNTMFKEKVYLGHHDNGRPYIQNESIEISISHAKRFVAIILHPFEDVGIDIESLDRDFSAVEAKALSEDEIDDLSEKEKVQKLQLAIYWCAKEAIYKRMSLYGVDFAEQIEIDRFNPDDEGELDATFYHKDGTKQEFELEYLVFENYTMVWVVGEKE